MLRKVLIVVGALVVSVLILAGIFVYRYRNLVLGFSAVPESLKTSAVVIGKNSLSSDDIPVSGLGTITDIESNSGSLIVAGTKGAAALSVEGSLLKSIHFQSCGSDPIVLREGYLCRGSWARPVQMLGPDGRIVWKYEGGMQGIDDATVGRFGSTDRVVVGFNGGGGVRMLAMDGKEMWKQDDGNVWHVETISDGKSDSMIVHSNVRGELTIRDSTGRVVNRYKPEVYLAHFSLTAWGDEGSKNKLVTLGDDSIFVLTTEGKTVAKLTVPGAMAVQGSAKGIPVRFQKGTALYASLVRYELWDRAVLYVYNSANQLIYQEVIGEVCGDLRAVPNKGGLEDLLLGCTDKIKRYRAAVAQ